MSVRGDAKQFIFSISALTKYVVAGISWLLLEYLEPGSLTFSIAIGWLALTFLVTWTRYRLWAVPALLPLIAIVPINFFNATYHIASDQLRLKYRSVEGTTYFEFPGRWSLLKRLAKSQTAGELVEATTCDDRIVAMLPMLPYRPIQIEREALLTPFAFRRLT
ncbi:hypothetical protein [Bradyrhizobium erythrophlei]|uniref:hypothetical protein n=1 Tax=Bradyrhizobium erythrophlei TaxID=1437360 RepID=UPI0012AB7837|nr:hypothetical protein [Bradyrhizobium erythrophlei]